MLSGAAFLASAPLPRVSEAPVLPQLDGSQVAVPVHAGIFDSAALFFHADAARVRLQLIRLAGSGLAQAPSEPSCVTQPPLHIDEDNVG